MNSQRWWLLVFGLTLGSFALSGTAMGSFFDPPHASDCLNCHQIHGPSYPKLLGSLCESCHFDGGPAPAVATHSSRTTDTGYGNWDLDCWACHNPHTQEQNRAFGSTYGKYIRHTLRAQVKEIDPDDVGPYYEPLSILRTVSSDIVEFKGPTEFVDGDGEVDDDICQVCHENTQNYNKSTAQNSHSNYGVDSQPGGVCTSCHQHTAGFAPGGSCLDCHAQAQPQNDPYRRQVAGAGGDFERLSHHVTDGTTTEIVTAEDCVVCHDQGNHQANTDPEVLLNDPDLGPGSPYAYDGTGASVEGFCLGCHDADGSLAYDADGDPGNGRQPFSDGRTPPDIASDWTTASHSTAVVTELVQDKCLACHGGTDSTRTESVTDHNVHGSALPSLRSALVAGETVANPEEALCFACHDGSPAATDIEAMFAGTETAVAGFSGALVNTHHDVSDADQAYSGAKIECTVCHNVHAARAGARVVADPDPGDGRVPAPGNTWTESTFLSEFCLDCHDNSYPASVTPPTIPLTDIYDAWIKSGGGDKADQHGPVDASPQVNLRPGSGYARGDILQCTDCHNPGHGDEVGGQTYANLFNLKAVIYSKDGTTPLTPDWSIPGEDANLVRVLDISSGNTDPTTNGKAFCSTCHPDPMGGTKNAGCLDGSCHNHLSGRF